MHHLNIIRKLPILHILCHHVFESQNMYTTLPFLKVLPFKEKVK
jgi:hypothetical protein